MIPRDFRRSVPQRTGRSSNPVVVCPCERVRPQSPVFLWARAVRQDVEKSPELDRFSDSLRRFGFLWRALYEAGDGAAATGPADHT